MADIVLCSSDIDWPLVQWMRRSANWKTAGSTPAGKAMFGVMGVFAEFERAMIVERVKAGLSRARSQGKRLGRPSLAPDK
jgi:DNA invertase Pin-like site-specific DNA recombinase